MDSIEQNKRRVNRYVKWVIVCSFLLALLWPLGNFIFWIFAGAIAYLLFLIFYYSPRTPKNEFKSTRFSGNASSRQERSKPLAGKDLRKRSIIFLAVSFGFFILVFVMVWSAFDDGQNDKKETDVEQSIAYESSPEVDTLVNVGIRFYQANQFEKAKESFEEALKIDSKNKFALYNRALVYYSLNNYRQSIKGCYECLKYHPSYGYAHYLLGDNYFNLKQYDSAIISFEFAYTHDVPDVQLALNLGEAHLAKGNKNKAIRYFSEALDQDSSLVNAYDRLAEIEPSKANFYRKLSGKWR
jgi:Tfp pilus assembly protein PilF